jgi:hypothetical protein
MCRRRPHLTVVADQSVGGDPVFSASSPRAFSTWSEATVPSPCGGGLGRAGEGSRCYTRCVMSWHPPRPPHKTIFCELSIRETALATFIHQRRLTPSCGGQARTAEAAWMQVSEVRRVLRGGSAPIRNNCSPPVGRPVSKARSRQFRCGDLRLPTSSPGRSSPARPVSPCPLQAVSLQCRAMSAGPCSRIWCCSPPRCAFC